MNNASNNASESHSTAGSSAHFDVLHFDVLIVGAGVSGIDAAYHLQRDCPDRRFALLEKHDDFGGTWRTHRFPGIRSDSDLFTYGFRWKPWHGTPIATAEKILSYLNEALDEQDLRRHIRYQHEITAARWCSEAKQWTLDVTRLSDGATLNYSANFLWMCHGYYHHDRPYIPDFPGMEEFQGVVAHPQTWPEDLDYRNKRVVVIGSGATAATLIPAMADDCEHITMLQRSPTFFVPRPNRNELDVLLRELEVPDEWRHEIVRRNNIREHQKVTRRSFEEPEVLRQELLDAAQRYLGDEADLDPHFTPRYRPWQQRLALIPDGDLFIKIREGKVSVVTDQIECFTAEGIQTVSGELLQADIIVTATGFDLCPLGDIEFTIDDQTLDFSECWAHRGIMFSGIPNMAWVFGYFRASWTLRADLISEFVCRLLNHMDEQGATMVTPELRLQDQAMQPRPWIEPENFNPGYITRNLHLMPKQGDKDPWVFKQDYYAERDDIPNADLADGTLVYR